MGSTSTAVRATCAAFAAILGSVLVLPGTAAQAQTKRHHSFLHRHRAAASVAAGLTAHHYAKKTARARAAHGQRPNFAQRHPILSGAAAAATTHHVLKHHH